MRDLLIRLLEWLLLLLQTTTEPPPPPDILWDERLTRFGITVEHRSGNRRLIAAWLTINGSWDDVPAWAKQWQRDTLGGDHHMYGRIERIDGSALPDRFNYAYPPFGDTDGAETYPEPDGWSNHIMAGQNWNPADVPGPYVVWVDNGDKLHGLGMPHNWHWSFFGVWQERTGSGYDNSTATYTATTRGVQRT